MKRLLPVVAALLLFQSAYSQITITSADMPVSGDTLRYSIASPVGALMSPGDSGTNVAWSYSLAPMAQAVDTYKTADQVSLVYAFTVGLTAIGYKVADTLPGIGTLLPVSIRQIYTFFEEKTGPSRYEAKAFAASISGLPTAANYSTPDVWYYFPLSYLSADSSAYALNITIATLGSLKESGYRKTRVDGWGTILTPYYTTPVNCIRVRSEIHEIDSLTFAGFPIGFPRNTVEYKWLVNGEHYPALWVTSTVFGGVETITGIRYRDNFRNTDTSVIDNAAPDVAKLRTDITVFPNPAFDGVVTLGLPANWKIFTVDVFDMQSRQVMSFRNEREINIRSLPVGKYVARVMSGADIGYVQITR